MAVSWGDSVKAASPPLLPRGLMTTSVTQLVHSPGMSPEGLLQINNYQRNWNTLHYFLLRPVFLYSVINEKTFPIYCPL
uniref:Cytochrome c oxidase subunit 7A2, mitochondrial n=1 Tax=Echinococcus granulosus TaxID=6210 RepID=A0A068WK44_ECHGR|nr:hypothetical protein EgrG_000661900 [Echinococcus granulosus]